MATSIVTKFLAPTNTKSARIAVKGFGKRKVYSWDYALDVTVNHKQAVQQFLQVFNAENDTDYAIVAFASIGIADADFVAIVQ